MDAKYVYDGISRLLATSSARELPKPVSNGELRSVTENGDLQTAENGEVPEAKQTEGTNADEGIKSSALQTDMTDTNTENTTK